MNRNLLVSFLVIVIGASIGGGYLLGKRNVPKTQTVSQVQTEPTPAVVTTDTAKTTTVTTPTVKTPSEDIKTFEPKRLFGATMAPSVTYSTAVSWEESPVTVVYKDFNGDGILDAFIWSKPPGTTGYSTAAVWTILAKAAEPKMLWHISADLAQSSWSVNAQNGLVEVGKQQTGTGIKDATVIYSWDKIHNSFTQNS